MKRAAYSIVITNERYKITKMVKIFFLLINVFAITYVALITDQPKRIIWAVLTLFVVIGLFVPKKHKLHKYLSQSSAADYLWLAIGWMSLENYWMLLAVIVFALINSMLKERHEIKFFDNLITINTFPQKEIKWFELNNVMLKDGILTIDFRNDKLIQSEFNHEESDADNEEQFNNYCQQQLKIHSLAF
jgi:hypothetical protein